jgi:O-antigen/teichoic acid export membrane protein
LSSDKQNSQTLTHKDTRIAAFWKTTEYIGLILFLAVIPRSMGPEVYGNFAVILSMLGLFLLAGALGGMAVFGRFVPKYYADNQPELVNGLFTQFFLFRLMLALPLMVLLPVLLTHLRPDITFDVAVAAALAYFFGTISMACFQLFFGLNRIGLWLFHDSSSRVLLVILLVAYWHEVDLKNAVFSLAIIEFVLACLSVFWSRKYFDFHSSIQQLPIFVSRLKFGMTFFAANFLLMVIWRSGEIMVVSFSGEAEQVAYYNLANSIFLALYALFAQIGAILIPSVSSLHTSGQHEKKDQWLGLMLKYLTVATLLALILINAIGEPVLALLLGQGYSEVTDNLYIIAISLVPLNIVNLGFTTAVVHGQLRGTFWMAGLALITFLLCAMILTPELGAKGVSLSVAVSAFVAAAFAYRYFRLSSIAAMAEFWKIVGMGSIFLGFVMFSGYPLIETGIAAFVVFACLLLLFRLVRISELLGMIIDKNKKTRAVNKKT